MNVEKAELRLEAKGLSKEFKKNQSVKSIDFEINSGEVVDLLGPNGAGKTTSFYMVVGLLYPSSGSVFIRNRYYLFANDKRARLGVGYLPQNVSIFRKLL